LQSPEASAEAAAEVLRGTRGKWALIGALAASAYRSRPRLTTDVDFLAADPAEVARAFREAGYQVAEQRESSSGAITFMRVLENWRTARPN